MEALSTCVLPVLLCGPLHFTDRAMKHANGICRGRYYIGITLRDKLSNKKLQQLTVSENVAHRTTVTNWQWGGHVIRLQQDRCAQLTTMQEAYAGKRNQSDHGKNGQIHSGNKQESIGPVSPATEVHGRSYCMKSKWTKICETNCYTQLSDLIHLLMWSSSPSESYNELTPLTGGPSLSWKTVGLLFHV